MKRTLLLLALPLWACAPRQPGLARLDPIVTDEVLAAAEARPSDSALAAHAKEGVRQLRRGRHAEAGKAFAAGLRLDPTDANLHFLNGLSYHLRSLSGDQSMLEFAESGYSTSLRLDSGNPWPAYLLGQVYFQQKRFVDAQNQFSYALLFAPENPAFLRALSAASYYASSLDVSHWAAEKAARLEPKNASSWRAAALTRAAVGDFEGARKGLGEYQTLLAGLPAVKRARYDGAAQRVKEWESFHGLLLAQSPTPQSVFGSGSKAEGQPIDLGDSGSNAYDQTQGPPVRVPKPKNAAAQAPAVAAPAPADDDVAQSTAPRAPLPNMALVDVVIIRTEENRFQAKGVNLLDGIRATLTGTLYAFNRVTGFREGGAGAYAMTHTIAPTFALAGLQYNLNIFNDGINKAEVLARPSLLAVDNKPSTFYSGAVLHVQLDSNNSDGSLVDIPVGITLSVTPTFLDSETVSITVHAERGFIDERNEKLGFSVFSQTSKTSVDATAVLRFGETLVLSGLSENSSDKARSGVPFLQNLPVIQYLFSRKTDSERKNSALILISPSKQRYAGEVIDGQAAAAAKATPAPKTGHTETLRKRVKIPVRGNLDAVAAHLQGGRYFEQIRTGDLQLDEWHNSDSLFGALKRALEFLYY